MIDICVTIDTEGDSANNTNSTFWGIEVVLPELLRLFSKYDVKATFFVQEDHFCQIASTFTGLWTYLQSIGHEIAYHAHGLIQTTTEEKDHIITEGIRKFREFGLDPVSFRAGRYHFDSSVLRILEKNGIKYDSSVVPGLREYSANGFERCNHIGAPNTPYFPSYENHCREGDSKVLELPINRYPKLPPAVGGKLIGKMYNEEILFDYFYHIRKDSSIILNLHTWSALRNLIKKFLRDQDYGKIRRLAFQSSRMLIGSPVDSSYITRFDDLLGYILKKGDTRFVTIRELGENIVSNTA